MRKPILFIVLMVLFVVSCKETDKVENNTDKEVVYEVVFREKLAGEYTKKITGDNSYNYFYTYTDRGRGPEYTEHITLNEDSFIIDQSIEGVNYRKVPVSEYFKSNSGAASWENSKGEDKGKIKADELYFRYDGSPAIYEILAQKLLATNVKKVNLFPKGEAELVKNMPMKLENGTELDLLMIKGLDMSPTYLWMKGDQMIASIDGNLHVIQKDYVPMRSEMQKMQGQVEDDYLIEISKTLTHDIDKVVIKNVNVFTEEGSILENQDVFVDGDIIKEISPTDKGTIYADAQVVDGTEKTLMPGMFDMHTHNGKSRGILHVAGGITSVRDLANNKQLYKLRDQFEANDIIGPHIVTFCGIIDGPGPFANQRNVVETLEEGLAEIQDYKDLGYQQIKLYSSIKPEWVKPLIDKAHGLGMRVSGHIPAFMTASQAINQGYNEIQHINMLFLNFLGDTIDTRTPLRFTMVAKHGLDLDLKSKEYLDFVDLLKRKDILIDPTVAIFENMFVSQKGEPSPTYSKIMNRLPVINQRQFYAGGLPKTEITTPIYKESYDNMLAVVNDLFNRGVTVVPGTDGLPGFLYHRELELYVRAGIPVAEVLKLATIKSAKITGTDKEYGSIKEGKKADLILVDGNPLSEISDIRRVEWTMKGAHMFYSKELYDVMGISNFE
ncbi:amidohydrolase family protein [Cellulophaga baltica]|uniref:amidohydrolase family protein n=1 Tax=Cellulophaga TaxID=104264 RepID=UPI001C077293|nr:MULTISPECIES: amidohydrolase family protein [Cellulophaga]MBU2996663.1 amidohydrolase family protein [Cellulophaga baltica]MDO6768057.1 amidohydrolase family protein [Cellulophaga sp. 1_MG-2023]